MLFTQNLVGNGKFTLDQLKAKLIEFQQQDGEWGNYLTTEQDTGRTWIGGKAIYQKSFIVINSPDLNANITTLLSAVGVESIIKSEIVTEVSTVGFLNNFYFTAGSASVWWQVSKINANDVEFKIVNGTGKAINYFYVTLFYTKVA